MRGMQQAPPLLHGPRRPLRRSAPKELVSPKDNRYLVYLFDSDEPFEYAFSTPADAVRFAIAHSKSRLDILQNVSVDSVSVDSASLKKACSAIALYIESMQELLEDDVSEEVFKGWVGLSEFQGSFKIDFRIRGNFNPYA
jgi:hypothetical protein